MANIAIIDYNAGNTLSVKKACEYLVGEHDFTSFMASGSKITDPVRTVKSVDVIREDGEIITFSICADGFLYNMVRIITGTLIDLNLGRLDKTMTEIIEARDRSGKLLTVGYQNRFRGDALYMKNAWLNAREGLA